MSQASQGRKSPLSFLNSIHAHLLALSVGVIAALTSVSLTILWVLSPPSQPPVTVYEMARIVRGQPIIRPLGEIEVSLQAREPPRPATDVERVLSDLLAARLGVSSSDVRVRLDKQDRQRASTILREVALYSADGMANPIIVGTFSLAVRQGEKWRIITRESLGPFYLWRLTGWEVLIGGILLVLPLTLWFSARLAQPIKAFAASAQRLGGRGEVELVSVAGPTEIRLAAQALNEMQASISRHVRERTTLLGAIAHDLRTPLSRLHFHLTGAPTAVRSAVEEEIREMERMVGVVLEFVENETRPQVHEPLDLSMLVEGVADDFADVGKDVRVTASEPITTVGDPLLLKRLFANIVDNAVNYGRSAEIGIRRENGHAVVDVEDRGRGMSEEEIGRAFEPFFRGEPSRNRKTGGVGLGLSIVKTAADAHGGTVELANAANGGLRVRVRLPIREPGTPG